MALPPWPGVLSYPAMNLLAPKKHDLLLAACAPLLLWSGFGCQRTYQTEYAPVATHSVQYDEALARRDWARSTAYYGSGDVIAGPTNSNTQWRIGDGTQPDYYRRQRMAAVAEPLIALGNMIALPVSLVRDPPMEDRRYEGTVIGPTYTAAVPPSELGRETERGRRALDRAARQREASGQRRDSAQPDAPGADPDAQQPPSGGPAQGANRP